MKILILDARGQPLISGGEELVNVAEICRLIGVHRSTFNSMVDRYGSVEQAIRQYKQKHK
ncbi:Uncharacterised protein [Serratia quinivorans]|uniref:hypothetical protein n=1 Tax=Serratia TaxID=613 RepID=UPI00217A5AD5|nr:MULTISPECIES: hypothetical protein [Serratia]CAI1721811.1 Uncharacterised protein [Serratia quinivorans]CAI2789919.1 Uncharacterised protein [Serratia grimesii]